MSPDEIKTMITDAIRQAYPKEWITREELMKEFDIKKTHLQELLKDPHHPLPYSSFGPKKQVFSRQDINTYLLTRKRNG